MEPQPQASLYEATIENAELEQALETRLKAKEKLGGGTEGVQGR